MNEDQDELTDEYFSENQGDLEEDDDEYGDQSFVVDPPQDESGAAHAANIEELQSKNSVQD